MRLKLKFETLVEVVEIDSTEKLHEYKVSWIKLKAKEIFPFLQQGDFFLSLNKKDHFDEEKTLRDIGLVHGDIIHITPREQQFIPNQCTSRPQLLSEMDDNVQRLHFEVPFGSAESFPKENFPEKVNTTDVYHQHEHSMDFTVTAGPSSRTTPSYSEVGQNFEDMQVPKVDQSLVNRYLREPMLCRESTAASVPAMLSCLYAKTKCQSAVDALCIVIHALMCESGFSDSQLHDQNPLPGKMCSPKEHIEDSTEVDSNQHSDNCQDFQMPLGWNTSIPNVFKMKYHHHTYAENAEFILTCVPMGRLLTVNILVSGPSSKNCSCNVNLRVEEYIRSLTKDAGSTYCNLSKLSRIIKDGIALPVIQKHRAASNLSQLQGIMSLSQESKLRILYFLEASCILRLSQTCKEFNVLCRDKFIWRRLYLKTFGNRQNNSLTQDWLKIYKKEYEIRKERNRIWKSHTSPVLMPPTFPPFGMNPPGPFHPGILNGDHDLDPVFNHPNRPFFPHQMIDRRANVGNALFQPRFDPMGPLPEHRIQPGRGRGQRLGGDVLGSGFGFF